MGFLDNSGDIILDAVLTDAGRARLAAGDGSFKIAKYAFGDDEIDYAKYNKTNLSGSAFYDIDILRTPVLEAFTNNTSTMKSKLISIPRTNLLFLPVIKLNENGTTDGVGGGIPRNITTGQANGSYVLSVDTDTDNYFSPSGDGAAKARGVLRGVSNQSNKYLQVDQGLDTTAISQKQVLDSTLIETQFIVEMDNRLGSLANPSGVQVSFSFLDDDNIASYNITNAGQGSSFFVTLGTDPGDSPIAGPRGVGFRFRFTPSLELQTSDFLFTKIGSTGRTYGGDGTFAHIDTMVKITGATTGFSINIPLRYLKKTA